LIQRYARADKRAKLPKWINQYITDTAANLSTDMAIVLSKLFMRTISQTSGENQMGISLWSLEDVKKAQEKQKLLQEAHGRNEAQNRDIEMVDGENSEDYGDGGIPDEMLEGMDWIDEI
jgi:DNA excision repair protein ERCC-2